ncbi:hypothetical protein WN943_028491 [Citrus x changshan-huyou]
MAPQTQTHQTEKLVKVAKEGFALLHEFYGCPRKSEGRLNPTAPTYSHRHYIYKNKQPYVYPGPKSSLSGSQSSIATRQLNSMVPKSLNMYILHFVPVVVLEACSLVYHAPASLPWLEERARVLY